MTVCSSLGILLVPRRDDGIVGDRSCVGVAELGPLRDYFRMMTVWSALGILMGPRRKINKGKHRIGLDFRFITNVRGGGGFRWRQIVEFEG